MGKSETILGYLETVEEQIRWKRARPVVLLELRRHLEDQRDAFFEEGSTPEEAEQLAVEEMGDPVSVGAELDRIHRPKPQRGLLGLTVLLAAAGRVLRIWLTAGWAGLDISPIKTLTALLLGTVCMLGAYFLDYTWLGRHAIAVYTGAILAGAAALRWSPSINHASYYTRYVVLCYPVVYAVWLYACRGKQWRGLAMAILGVVPLSMIGLLAPYLAGALLLWASGLVLLLTAAWNDWFGIGKWKSITLPLMCAMSMIGYACWRLFNGYHNSRLSVFLHPEQDPYGTGYQALSVRSALSVSRWLGEGNWSDTAYPYSYEMIVPECRGDFFLTTIIYKLGWLPFLALAVVFAVLVLWLLGRCLRQMNQLGRMIALAVVLTLGLQAVCSVGLNMGYVLFSMSFPLVVGNLHMVLDMALIGLVLSVFRSGSIARDEELGRMRYKYVIVKVPC